MSSPAVSVILPAYNRSSTIQAAVRSVLEQSFTDFELIVVDDGSTDDTVATVEAIDDARLNVLGSDENQGVSAARNRGIGAARARWVAFQDSDDLWHPEKLARQMALLETSDSTSVAAYCGMRVETPGGSREVPDPGQPHREGDVLPGLARTSFISTQTLIVRRDILRAVGGFDEALSALVDWELMLRVAQYGPVVFVGAPLVTQRFSPNSITRDLQRRVAARAYIVEKHVALFDRHPGALADHHYALHGGYRRCGELALAGTHLAQARHRAPLRIRWMIAALWLWLLQSARIGGRP